MKLSKTGRTGGGELLALLVLGCLMFNLPVCAATTRYVVPPGTAGVTPTTPYTSWETAATSIADAIAASSASGGGEGTGDTILVAPGTYNISSMIVANKRRLTIKSMNRLTGQEDPENTVIDGGGATSILKLEAAFSSVSGFTFANGCKELSAYANNQGNAAVWMGNHYGSVSNCIFRGNKAVNMSGGCIIAPNPDWTPVVSGCIFTNNTIEVTSSDTLCGGVIRLEADSNYPPGRIENCRFIDNHSKAKKICGGVVYAPYAALDNCQFSENTFTNAETESSAKVTSYGGYVFLGNAGSMAGRCSMTNCRFTGRAIDTEDDDTILGTMVRINCPECIASNCTFDAIEENVGDSVQGMVNVGAHSAKLVGCKFTGGTHVRSTNSGGSSLVLIGGGITNVTFRNCLFSDNVMQGRFYAIKQYQTKLPTTGFTIENCTFANNTVGQTISGETSSTCTNYIVNSVFTSTLYLSAPGVVSNCCLASHSVNAKISYGDFLPSEVGGDLKFVDAVNGDYHLRRKSPLREKGMLLDWMTADAIDLDGKSRVVSFYGIPYSRDPSALPDIGCYEQQDMPPGFIIVVK